MIFVLTIDLKRVYSLGIAACPMALDSKHGNYKKTRARNKAGFEIGLCRFDYRTVNRRPPNDRVYRQHGGCGSRPSRS